MRIFFPILSALALLPHAVLAGDPAPQAAADAKKPRASSYVSVVKQGDGTISLDINYPWQSYTNTSVEVWLLPSDKPENVQLNPLRIVYHELNGKMSLKVGHCLEAAFAAGKVEHITLDERALDIIGQRNSMGKPAVCFAGKDLKYLDKQQQEDEEEQKQPRHRGSWAAFCELENWSLNRHQLQLDLSKTYFSKPGKLFIWFLRADTVVWETRIDWPGYKEQQ